LQPFSRKYFEREAELSTYDNRWQAGANRCVCHNLLAKSIWEWKITPVEMDEKRSIDDLYRILSDAPKYFLRTVCNMELPEDAQLLEDTEPFIVEKGLEEWTLADLILNDADYEKKIAIFKFRGKFPSGKFADNAIKKKIEQVREMQKLVDKNVKTFIKPSQDCGKYRLLHWLQHLEYNKTVAAASDIILLDKKEPLKIRLPELTKEFAEKEIEKLWALADELKTKLRPIFPNAAWEYKNSKKIEAAEKKLFGNEYNSQYTKMAIENARTFADLGIEEDFIECSKWLFVAYSKPY
jgi:exonuclease V gamma subunit